MKFEELKLTYGYPLQLQTAAVAGQVERFSCRLIGCLPGRSVLLSVPKQAGKLIRFRAGQKLVVRFMIDNGIGVFAGVVESQTQDPYPILHLSYPDAVTFKGIRGATRVAVREKIDVTNISREGKTKVSGFISDMSISGTRIELGDDIAEIGDTLELKALVSIRDIRQELTLIGVIRSRVDPTDNLADGALVSYGLEFVSQSDEQRLIMYAYVFNQMVLQENSVP
ncbi:flagellar brake protein [Cellvibrio sp. OA-2007]|uniref:flagellar brake protein n=1 Tax=Cellvibrio sp. OA-2007 TaxID=529823 RepID=UPI000780EB6A|nr:flagellar brake protein [Cellvibrio sp. OA-2007]